MSDVQRTIEKRVQLSPSHAERLQRFVISQHTTEDVVVERALDLLFSLTGFVDEGDEGVERQAWSALSDAALARIWNNDADASYDNWRELYGVPAG